MPEDTVESKEDRVQRERIELLSRITENTLEDVGSRVGFVLNHYPNTRNNDMDLVIQYWRIFDRDELGDSHVFPLEILYRLTRVNTIIRARAKIQNEYKLFSAAERVRQRRAGLDDEERARQVEEKPDAPLTSIYCDESGKNQNFIVIGSVWINDGYRVFKIYQSLTEWKKRNGIEYEFHFKELSGATIDAAYEFIKRVLSESDTLGFKAVIIRRTGIGRRTIERAIFDLHYQLVVQGVEHETRSGRFVLPRAITLTKDADDASDRLHLVQLSQELKSTCKSCFEGKLHVREVGSADSKTTVYLQLADLVTGAIARTLNHERVQENHPKDVFASRTLSLLKVNLEQNGEGNVSDFAKVIYIT